MKIKYRDMDAAWLWFVIHACNEIVCFSVLYSSYTKDMKLIFAAALIYDFFAFVPEMLFGELKGRLDPGSLGVLLMLVSLVMVKCGAGLYALVVLGLASAAIHTGGAVVTTLCSHGMLAHSAVFVGGGSFGVILGKLLGKSGVPFAVLFVIPVLMEVLILLAKKKAEGKTLPVFDLVRGDQTVLAAVLVSFLVIAVRSWLGSAIPVYWNRTVWQSVYLFFLMGAGKAAGGFLADRFGSRRTGVLSTIVSVPFLIFGARNIFLSSFGIFLFSLTMPITFGILLSVYREKPAEAFGITTIALFAGFLPMAFFGKPGEILNSILIAVLSFICAYSLNTVLKEKV